MVMEQFGWLMIVALLAALIGGAVIYGIARRQSSADPHTDLAELHGRIAQLSELQVTSQANLTRLLEERLADFGHRLGSNLVEQGRHTAETLSDLKERLAVLDAAQGHVANLAGQVTGLQNILSNKQARGLFGEIQLEDLVRQALPSSRYRFQATLTGEGGIERLRCDCLIDLPHPPGPIAIDAKFPLESYHGLHTAPDPQSLKAAQKQFAQAMQEHIRSIASKYIVPGVTADSALLFLPSEAIYAELHSNFRAVVEESFRHKVWIVSPTSLMATLITVRAVLRDVEIREHAALIHQEMQAMLLDFQRLEKRAQALEGHFDRAIEDLRALKISTDKLIRRGTRVAGMELDKLPAAAESLPLELGTAGK